MAGERSLPGIGLLGFWTEGSNGWGVQHSEGLRLTSVLVQPRCKSFVAAVPVSPANGDIHVLTGAPNLNSVAVRDNGSWVYLSPAEGFTIYDEFSKTFFMFNGASWVPLLPMPSGSSQAGLVPRVNTAGTGYELGDPRNDMRLRTAAGAYALILDDAGRYIRMTSASAVNLTVPADATANFPVGTVIQVRQAGAGQVTFAPAGGVTINSAETLKLRKQGSTAALIKIAANSWDVTGDLEAAP